MNWLKRLFSRGNRHDWRVESWLVYLVRIGAGNDLRPSLLPHPNEPLHYFCPRCRKTAHYWPFVYSDPVETPPKYGCVAEPIPAEPPAKPNGLPLVA